MSLSKHAFLNLLNDSFGKQQPQTFLIEKFLEGKILTFAIGKNEETKKLQRLARVSGVIDDFEAEEEDWEGIPIVTMQDIPEKALVINCSTSISPVKVKEILKESRINNVLHVSSIIEALDGEIENPWFVDQMREDVSDHFDEWFQLYQLLSDEESKQTLLDVMRFRLSADPAYMNDYRVRMDEQYFEPFLNINGEIFVDAGGFDGDTTEVFCTEYPDYEKVLFFEPSTKNLRMAKRRLEGVNNIKYHRQGLSDKQGKLSFNPDLGSASNITENSKTTSEIEITTLDEEITDPVTFIKMDLEGWEHKALKGSSNHILNDHPKLAIAVYHQAGDFRTIKKYILSIRTDYKIYLRHYTQGWSETVMYFVPDN